jgi:hypothetical protein
VATIIALSGWKRSGKDTAAEYLITTYGAKRIAFADPLKDSVAKEFNLDRASIDDPALKEAPILHLPVDPRDKFSKNITHFMRGEFRDQNGKRYGEGSLESIMYWTRRALCILKGSTMRSVDADYWVKQAAALATGHQLYVISDLRYTNEANSLKKSNSEVITVRINRFDSSPSEDPSERDLDNYNFDYVISNTGTLEELNHQLDMILRNEERKIYG